MDGGFLFSVHGSEEDGRDRPPAAVKLLQIRHVHYNVEENSGSIVEGVVPKFRPNLYVELRHVCEFCNFCILYDPAFITMCIVFMTGMVSSAAQCPQVWQKRNK